MSLELTDEQVEDLRLVIGVPREGSRESIQALERLRSLLPPEPSLVAAVRDAIEGEGEAAVWDDRAAIAAIRAVREWGDERRPLDVMQRLPKRIDSDLIQDVLCPGAGSRGDDCTDDCTDRATVQRVLDAVNKALAGEW